MTNRMFSFACGLAISIVAAALNYQAALAAGGCIYFPASETECNLGVDNVSWSRSLANSTASSAVSEPYSTLGGWWIDNNVADPFHGTKGYEGVDCSGLVFKSWAMKYIRGTLGATSWAYNIDVHGPYQARDFKDSCNNTGACRQICGNGAGLPVCSTYAAMALMDAFASATYRGGTGHVALFVTRNASGVDELIEAQQPGLPARRFWSNAYRTDTSFYGIRRNGW